MKTKPSELIAWTMVGNGQSNPKAGPVSWALQSQFDSLCRQFADSLEIHEPGFDREVFLRECGYKGTP